MDFRQHLSFEKGIRGGQPCVRGTRIAVSDILEYLGSGMTISQIVEDFPSLTERDVLAALLFAAELTHCSSRLFAWKYIPSNELDDIKMYLRDMLENLTAIANIDLGAAEAKTAAAESLESVGKVVRFASRL
jgi:uncharacterized protein (DUF433 family)